MVTKASMDIEKPTLISCPKLQVRQLKAIYLTLIIPKSEFLF